MTHELLKDWARHLMTPYGFVAFVAAGALTTLTGPFGTYDSIPLGKRAVYWYGAIGVSIVLGMTIRWAVERRYRNFGFWSKALITSPIFSIIFTGFLLVYNGAMLGQAPDDKFPPWLLFLLVLSVPVFLNPVIYLMRGKSAEAEPVQKTRPDGGSEARLFQRLPARLGRQLIRVSVEDHYVTVFTQAGTNRLLMRFGDAVSELDDLPGLQVHRSHWVAKGAVRGFRVEGNRTLLCLKDGSEVPLSRKYRVDAERAGFLANSLTGPDLGTGARPPG